MVVANPDLGTLATEPPVFRGIPIGFVVVVGGVKICRLSPIGNVPIEWRIYWFCIL